MNENSHQFTLRIYYEDTDAGGIVYNANYLKFVERARTEWLRVLGVTQSLLLNEKVGFVVRKVLMDNIRAAKLDDELTVVSTINKIKRASLVFNQEIFNQHQQIICTIEVLIASVTIAGDTIKPCAISKEILGVLPRVS